MSAWWPLARKPEISRTEVLVILLASVLIISFELLWDPETESYLYEGTLQTLHELPQTLRYEWNVAYYQAEAGNWDYVKSEVLWQAQLMVNWSILFVNLTMPVWIWVRPRPRVWLWDVFGALNLMGTGLAGYYLGVGLIDPDVTHRYDFLMAYSWFGMLFCLAGAFFYGHLGSILLPPRNGPTRELS